MAQSHTQPAQGTAVFAPAYRKLHRACLAACLLLAPLVILLGFVFDPDLGVPQGASGIFAAFQSASLLRLQVFLWLNAVTIFFSPLSYVGLGLLAMKRSPWLATLGVICGLVGSLPWGFFVMAEAQDLVMVQMGSRATFLAVGNGTSSQGVIVFYQLCWVIGHLLGYLLLGLALARSRLIPRWVGWLLVVSVPFQIAAYPAKQGLLQIVGFGLVFIASFPAAWALLKFRDKAQPPQADAL